MWIKTIVIIYLYNKCSTCREALEFLENKKVVITVKEITKEPPVIAELQKMLDFHDGNVKKLLNTSGLLYREMRLSEKLNTMSLAEVLALLNKNGMLVKRPFLIADHFGFTGFNAAAWSQRF